MRPFVVGDAPLICALNSDPEVLRFTRDPFRDLAHAEQVLLDVILPQYIVAGMGRLALHRRRDGAFVGWCGLKRGPDGEVDLGYRLARAAWGEGLATEAARACLAHGLGPLGLPRVVGRAAVENHASIAVLRKCGMRALGRSLDEGELVETYEALGAPADGPGTPPWAAR
jgi:RimJ/RimL family protein N-acetyltransferase